MSSVDYLTILTCISAKQRKITSNLQDFGLDIVYVWEQNFEAGKNKCLI